MLDVAVVGFGGLVLVGIVAFAWREMVPVVPFLYANARLQARSKYLVREEDWSAMAESRSLEELTGCLKDTGYLPYLEQAENILDYHLGIEKHFVECVENLKEMSPNKTQPLFDSYLMFWEAKMLKTIYRAKRSGVKMDEQLVFPVGKLTQQNLSKLVEAESLADVRVILSGTPYSTVFDSEYPSLEEFETAIDNFVFKNFVDKVLELKMYDGNTVIDLLNLKFDVQNLLVLLKLEARDAPEEERQKYLIKNDTPLFKCAAKLIQSKGIADFVEKCKGLPYYEPLREALSNYERDNSLSHFERVLYKFYKDTILMLERYHFQGPVPLFTYLAKKEVEMRNLMIISKGVDSQMSPLKIKELIV